ncbi:MAG TPA: hypothetical protein VNU92_12035 [Edaphobacter sp.]|jgi:hypothetical protein|nr:hypothetical protein [Edaphobacter sp.]
MAWIRTTLSLTSLVFVLLRPSHAQQPTAQATSSPAADATRRLLTKSGTLRLLSKTEADIDGVDADNKPAKLVFHFDPATKCDQVKIGDVVSIVYRTDVSGFIAVRIALMVANTAGKTGDVGGNAKSVAPAPAAAARPQSTTTSASNSGSTKGIGGLFGGLSHSQGNRGSVGALSGASKSGSAATRDNNASIADVHDPARGMDIHHSIGGTRRVSTQRQDGTRVVSVGHRRGYVQRSYVFQDAEYVRRTYDSDGRLYDTFYVRYQYRGETLYVYTPSRFYPSAFYSWALNPWAVPVVHSWKWSQELWYGQAAAIFTPYPAYPSASLWLTDYIIADNVKSYFIGNVLNSGAQPLFTPEIKQAIADEIRHSILLEQIEAASNAQRVAPNPSASSIMIFGDKLAHILIASSDLDVVDTSGVKCTISSGDVLQLNPTAFEELQASAIILVGKRNECEKGSRVYISIPDLQDMQNYLRASVDLGLDELRSPQGIGLPALPASAEAAATPAIFIINAPPPEEDVPTRIFEQQQIAQDYELEHNIKIPAVREPVTSTSESAAVAASPTNNSSPLLISLNNTDTAVQVIAAMGKPRQILNLGGRTIYVYADIKVTFTNGKVTDVQ